jgi:hypothetical protein
MGILIQKLCRPQGARSRPNARCDVPNASAKTEFVEAMRIPRRITAGI